MPSVNDHLASADPDRTNVREASEHTATLDATLDSTRPSPTDQPPGSPSVAGYRITGEIAKGGMGRVYAAVDLTLDREVAIKTLLPGANADRFVTESKITAKLPHPNIPPVYELGELADGTPFLAMKLVRGDTLSALLKARPNPSHDQPHYVHIFEQIAQAVGFAHSRGVIHRDLKPLNVMVGEFGEVQVMDWGLAKGTSRDREGAGDSDPAPSRSRLVPDDHTHAGAVLGTPGYMAPEQARGEPLDARADVFALGATLAVILTGQPAFVGRTANETVQKAATAELADVFARLDACGADADLIAVAKRCLSARPDSRPADGRAVATEVGAYRAGVEARLKQAETERAQADTRRRVVQWAAGVVAAVLLAGVVGTSLGMLEAQRQTGFAREQETEANRQTGIAQTNAAEAKRMEGIAKGETAEKEKARKDAEEDNADLWAGLDVMTAKVVGDSLGTQKAVSDEQKAFLGTVLPLYRKLAAKKGNDEATRARVARAVTRVGLIEERIGRKGESADALRQAGEAYERLVADFPAVPDYRSGLAGSHTNLGILLADLGKQAEAEQQYRKGLAIQEKLVADFPTVPDYRSGLAGSHINLGLLLADLGNGKDAEGQYRKGLAIQEKLVADFPAVPEYRNDLATSHNNLGNLMRGLGKEAEAERQYRKGLAIREKLAADFPAVPDYRSGLGGGHFNLGNLLRDLGNGKDAEGQYRKGLAIDEKLAADFPAVPEYRQNLAKSHGNLGVLLADLGKRAEAEAQYQKGLAIQKKLATDFPAVPEYQVDLGGGYCNLGNLVCDDGRPTDSLKWYGMAIDTLRPVHETEPRGVTAKQFLRNSHWRRALAYDQLKKHTEAVQDWDRAVELSPKEVQPEVRAYRVTSKLNAGQVAEAVAEVAELRKIPGCPPPVLYDFARVYSVASTKIADEKQNYADRAMELLTKAVKGGFKDVAMLKADKQLDPLRERDDFKKLLAEMEK